MNKCFVMFRKDGEEDKKVHCNLLCQYSLLKNSDTDAFIYYNGILLAGDPDPFADHDNDYDYRFWGNVKDLHGNDRDRYELTIFDRMPRVKFCIQIADYKRGIRSVFAP